MSIPTFRVDIHHHIHTDGTDVSHWEEYMNRFSAKLEQLTAAVTSLEAAHAGANRRIAEDLDELKRLVEEGTATEEQVAEFQALVARVHDVAESVNAIDLLPEFPPVPGSGDFGS